MTNSDKVRLSATKADKVQLSPTKSGAVRLGDGCSGVGGLRCLERNLVRVDGSVSAY